MFVAGLLKSEFWFFETIGLGLIRGSSKSEFSLPIRGSTSKLDEFMGLVLAEGMLLISETLLIIKSSALARLNSDVGSLAVSIKLSCSEFSVSPGVW